MIVTCPDCATRYDVEDSAFSSGGRAVRCNHCGCEWYQIGPSGGRAPAAHADPEDPRALEAAAARALSDYEERPAQRPSAGGRGGVVADEPARLRLSEAIGPAAAPSGLRPRGVRGQQSAPPALLAGSMGEGGATEETRRKSPLWMIVGPAVAAMLIAAPVGLYLIRQKAVEEEGLQAAAAASEAPTAAPRDATPYAAPPPVAAAPPPAAQAGVIFVEYKYDLVERAEGPALEVWGRIANNSDHEAASPTIEIVSRDENGKELQRWLARPEQENLAPGESAKFSSRMMYPTGPVHNVEFYIAAK